MVLKARKLQFGTTMNSRMRQISGIDIIAKLQAGSDAIGVSADISQPRATKKSSVAVSYV